MYNSSWSFSWSWCMRHAPSIQSSESTLFPVPVISPSTLLRISFDITSTCIRIAYSLTDSTRPCVMLCLILFSLVGPYLVWMLAVSWEFSLFTMVRFFRLLHSCWAHTVLLSSQALSYVFWTSRKITYAVFPSSRISWIILFQHYEVVCCSTAFPPAWASVIWVTSLIISFMVRSYTFPILLARVILLSLEHFPFCPLP